MEATLVETDAWGQTPEEVESALREVLAASTSFRPMPVVVSYDYIGPDAPWPCPWPETICDDSILDDPIEHSPAESGIAQGGQAPTVVPASEMPVWQLPDAEVRAEFVANERLISQLRARQACLLVEWQRREPDVGAAQTVAEQVHASQRITLKAARAQVLQAEQLHQHQQILRAVESGEASYDQAIAAASGLDALPDHLTRDQRAEAETYVVQRVSEFDPGWLRQLARRVVSIVAPEADDVADAAHLARQEATARRDRFLTWQFDGEGSVNFRGSLPVADAEPLLAAIKALSNAPRGDDQTAFSRPSRNQRQADALVRLALLALQSPELPVIGGSRPRIVVTLPLATLLTGLGDAVIGHQVFDQPQPLSPETARRLACDAEIVPVVLGSKGEPLDVGRSHRLVTGPMRTALAIRDAGCVFPGCDRPPPECDAHHIVPWWAGGETKLSNLVLLCPHHHMVVEPSRDRLDDPGRWRVRINPADGMPEALPPAHIDPDMTPRRHARHRLDD